MPSHLPAQQAQQRHRLAQLQGWLPLLPSRHWAAAPARQALPAEAERRGRAVVPSWLQPPHRCCPAQTAQQAGALMPEGLSRLPQAHLWPALASHLHSSRQPASQLWLQPLHRHLPSRRRLRCSPACAT